MPRTRKSAFALISALVLFIDWASTLLKEVKKLGGDAESIYKFFADKAKIAETAKLIVERVKAVFAGNEYLKLLSGEKELILDAQDGSKLISEQKDIFAYIDNDLINYGANEQGEATGEQKVQVFELIQDSEFTTFFNSVGVALDKLCLTQAQIINFVCKYKDWLRTNGYATFFLFKSGSKFFVAYVHFSDGGRLRVHVYRLGYDCVLHAENRPRVVLPRVEA